MIVSYTLLDTADDTEELGIICTTTYDPEKLVYNISVMWNVTNPLLIEAVGVYHLIVDRTTIGLLDQFHFVSLQPEV